MARRPKGSTSIEPGNLTPEEFQKFVREAYKLQVDVSEKADELKSAVSALRTHRKNGKKNLGIDLEAFQMFTALQNSDPDDAALRIKNLQKYTAWMNMPWGSQLDMFAGEDAEPLTQDQKENATAILQEETGYLRGVAGDEADANPHEAGSVAFVAWEKGRAKGSDFHKGKVAAGVNVRKPRGTRRKGGNPEDAVAEAA